MKPGILTTEFWLAAATEAVGVLLAHHGSSATVQLAGLGLALVALVGYVVSRTFVKASPAQVKATMLKRAAQDLGEVVLPAVQPVLTDLLKQAMGARPDTAGGAPSRPALYPLPPDLEAALAAGLRSERKESGAAEATLPDPVVLPDGRAIARKHALRAAAELRRCWHRDPTSEEVLGGLAAVLNDHPELDLSAEE